MKLIRCKNGHFFDGDKYYECPHCIDAGKAQQKLQDADSIPHLNETDLFSETKETELINLPDELSEFVLGEKLGRGSSGNVYIIKKTLQYAVKVIEWNRGNSRLLAKREFGTAKFFEDCPYIIRYKDYYEGKNASYIVQELATPWKEYKQKHILTIDKVLNVAISMCKALKKIHAIGFQHYDVNPQNIFVSEEYFKLGDFSHAFPFQKGKVYNHKLGTPMYMAPEIANLGECSCTEDIYSLGITMYTMLTGGDRPFDYGVENQGNRRREDSIHKGLLDIDIIAVIEKATAYDPSERYQTIDEFEEAIVLLRHYRKDLLDNVIVEKREVSDDLDEITSAYWEHISTEPLTGTLPVTEGDDDNENEKTDIRDCASIMLPDSLNVEDDGLCYPVMAYEKIPNDYFDDKNILKIDEVQFSAIMETSARRDDYAIIEIGMYTAQLKDEVIEKLSRGFSGEIKEVISNLLYVEEGAKVTVKISASGIEFDEPEITLRWNGKYLKFSFDFYIPEDYRKNRILFKAHIYLNHIIATCLKFTIDIRSEKTNIHAFDMERRDVKSAFLSYAREDLERVTYIRQAIRKARPDLDVFFDVETLRSGDHWQKRLYTELLKRDFLYLCWSKYAAASEWVNREWTYMKEKKGVEAIEPIPLDDTRFCPIPEDLQGLHFNDIEVMIRNACDRIS